jgi:hypothetical protein
VQAAAAFDDQHLDDRRLAVMRTAGIVIPQAQVADHFQSVHCGHLVANEQSLICALLRPLYRCQ